MPKIALVTVLFNSDSVLEGFFKSLSAQLFKDYHLYLVDNTPNPKTDNLVSQLVQKYPVNSMSHIHNTENVGVAKGNNQGIEKSLAEGFSHTLLLNNDIEFDQANLLSEMLLCSILNKEDIIVPKIYFYDTRKVWLAGGKFSQIKGIAYHVGLGEDDKPEYNIGKHFDYSPTCFMLINNRVFDIVGLMDERYFVYFDDTDFILRAVRKGYRVYYMPTLTVLHKVSSSTGGAESLFTLYYTTRNRIYFINKNFRGWRKICPLFYAFATRFVRYLFTYNSEQRRKMMHAVKDALRML